MGTAQDDGRWFPIPKGLHHSALGCSRERTTQGQIAKMVSTLKGLHHTRRQLTVAKVVAFGLSAADVMVRGS
jgi:hypothetical protein